MRTNSASAIGLTGGSLGAPFRSDAGAAVPQPSMAELMSAGPMDDCEGRTPQPATARTAYLATGRAMTGKVGVGVAQPTSPARSAIHPAESAVRRAALARATPFPNTAIRASLPVRGERSPR